MKISLSIISLATILTFVACKSTPPVNPTSEKVGAIGVKIELKTLISILGNKVPDKVYFAKLSGPNLKTDSGILTSTWKQDSAFYLLNVAPGDYAMVAVSYVEKGQTTSQSTAVGGGTLTVTTSSTYGATILLPEALVNSTRVTVKSGQLAFAGDYFVTNDPFKNADEVQWHYAFLLNPEQAQREKDGSVIGLFANSQIRVGNPITSKKDESNEPFVAKAREHFAETPWSSFVGGSVQPAK